MLLKDFALDNKINFDMLNDYLSEKFNVSIDKSTKMSDLESLRASLIEEYNRLKIKESQTLQHPELTKQLLMVEAVSCAIKESYKPAAYERVLNWLYEFAVKQVEVGDSVDEAVNDAMRQYRSSKWRFPDFEVDFDLRNKIKDYIKSHEINKEVDIERVSEMKSMDVKKLRALLESELDQAEVIVAAKGFAQELQDMIEKIGRMQNEDLAPVVDQMREAHGADVATSFGNLMSGELDEVMTELKDAKSKMDHAISSISEGGSMVPGVDMDADVGFSPDPEMDVAPDMDMPVDDEFGGDEAMSGPEDEPLGRETKESKMAALKNQITEMQAKLSQYKKDSK